MRSSSRSPWSSATTAVRTPDASRPRAVPRMPDDRCDAAREIQRWAAGRECPQFDVSRDARFQRGSRAIAESSAMIVGGPRGASAPVPRRQRLTRVGGSPGGCRPSGCRVPPSGETAIHSRRAERLRQVFAITTGGRAGSRGQCPRAMPSRPPAARGSRPRVR